jgi:hypothetical protein
VVAPIALFKARKFCLQQKRRATFQALNQIRNSSFGAYSMCICTWSLLTTPDRCALLQHHKLHEQISPPSLYVAFQNVIAIFRAPNNARRQTSNRMMSVPIIFHLPLFYIDFSGSKLKSCAESA